MRKTDVFVFAEGKALKIHNPFYALTKFERRLWMISIVVVTVSFLFSNGSWLNLIASLIGVTALIFVSKGYVIGQVLTVVFAVFYGFISFHFRYYGEMLTYMCMTAPIAAAAVISWARNQYKDTSEVKINPMTRGQMVLIAALSVAVTAGFFFILKAFNTANLIISTVSVTTSFLASAFTFMRSPYYAVAYAANDIVLIILWVLATIEDISYLPMIFCFVMFFVNDMYGFFNWRKIEKRQKTHL